MSPARSLKTHTGTVTNRPSANHLRRNGMKHERRSSTRDEVLLQPWFLPRTTALAIQRLLPSCYRDRMASYFKEYGCLRCNRRKVLYSCCGLCERCKVLIQGRLLRSAKRQMKNSQSPIETNQRPLDPQRIESARSLLADLAPKKLKSPMTGRIRKSHFANPDRGSYSPSIRR
jgi:hypothetical protein